MDFDGGDEIRFERRGRTGVATLTRPQALNAVSHRMVKALSRALTAWDGDDEIAAILIMGEGRAFSAGGDILQVYHAGKAGAPFVEFFADEYRLNAQIARLNKPYVALIDGIVMGGGFGVSFHGSHRVLTENATFAMPEVGIGFFPDVGGSYILPRLDNGFGLYLALTGNRIRYGDALATGLATHTIKAADQVGFIEAFIKSGEPEAALGEFSTPAAPESDQQKMALIARHFTRPSLKAIIRSLEEDAPDDEFAQKTLAIITSRSPTSLKVTWRQINAGLEFSMDECMRMEFRILNRMLAGHDFYEGIRAALIDKGLTPVWSPSHLDDVDATVVDAYFAPLGDGELIL